MSSPGHGIPLDYFPNIGVLCWMVRIGVGVGRGRVWFVGLLWDGALLHQGERVSPPLAVPLGCRFGLFLQQGFCWCKCVEGRCFVTVPVLECVYLSMFAMECLCCVLVQACI